MVAAVEQVDVGRQTVEAVLEALELHPLVQVAQEGSVESRLMAGVADLLDLLDDLRDEVVDLRRRVHELRSAVREVSDIL